MESSNLYALPKDALIYLISTITHDLKNQLKKTEENTQFILNSIREKSKYASIERCSFKGCHRFFFFEEQSFGDVEYYNDGRITFCSCLCECSKNADKGIGWWCKEHVPSNYIILKTKEFDFMCENCANNIYCIDNGLM